MQERAAAFPSRGQAWLSTAIVFILTVIAMADRMAISMLIGPIKADFAIGDFQASLLVGLAFTIFYVIFLIPIGSAADRWSRKRVLAICLLIWSVTTIACGFAWGFASLFVLRMLVGSGEAAIGPCSHGIIGASFPRNALAKPLAVQGIGFQTGSAVGVAAAGAVLAAGAAGAFKTWPVIGDMAPWRIAFIAIGVPGLLALLLIPLLHDPQSDRQVPHVRSDHLLRFLREHVTLVTLALLAAGTSAIALGSITGWVPEYLQRTLGLSPMEAGGTMGLAMLVAAVTSQAVYSIGVDWLAGRGVLDAPVTLGLLPMALAIPAALLAFDAKTAEAFAPLFFLLLLCVMPSNALNNTVMQMIAPARLRSRLSAVLILVISVIGFAGGPALVGALSQYVVGEDQLGVALQLVNVVAVAITLILLMAMRRPLRQYMAAREMTQ